MNSKTTELCAGGCGKPGIYYKPTSDNYWCNDNHRKCPGYIKKWRSSLLKRNYNSKAQRMKRQLEREELKCVSCGETAKHLVGNYTPCCMPRKKQCPNFHEYLSNKFKQRYANNPEHVEKQRQIALDVNNRPEVIEKKREKMLMLHRGDCDECKEFQENYLKGLREGQRRRRGPQYELNRSYLLMKPITSQYDRKELNKLKKFLGIPRYDLILLAIYKKYGVEIEDLKEAIDFGLEKMREK
jgi:hypothetical protein